MAQRTSAGDSLGDVDFKEMMKTPFGKWFFAPAVMAILAIAAWGLILTLLQLQNGLPKWVYSAPGLPTVAIYYTIQLRKVWLTEVKPEVSLQAVGQGIGKQTVQDNAIVPNVQGDHNVIHQTIIQNHAPPGSVAPPPPPLTPSSPAPPAPSAQFEPPKATIELKEREPTSPDEATSRGGARESKTLHDGEVKVPPGAHEPILLDLEKGDVLKGALLSNAPFIAFILSERAYNVYWKTREPGSARMLCNDDLSAQFRWTAPRTGRYFLVLDTFGKQAKRNIWVRLERLAIVSA